MRPQRQHIPRTEARTLHEPLGGYLEQFCQHLERQLYSPATIDHYRYCPLHWGAR
jgi:type VI protein secretion system component VasF